MGKKGAVRRGILHYCDRTGRFLGGIRFVKKGQKRMVNEPKRMPAFHYERLPFTMKGQNYSSL